MTEEIQEYKDTSKITNEELWEYMQKPYKSESGIVVRLKFNPNGDSINECWKRYLRRKLENEY